MGRTRFSGPVKASSGFEIGAAASGMTAETNTTVIDSDGYLYQAGTKKMIDGGREAFANAGTSAADVLVTVTFATAYSAAPIVTLGVEAALTAYISTTATTTTVKITVKSVPAGSTVYCNWTAIGS